MLIADVRHEKIRLDRKCTEGHQPPSRKFVPPFLPENAVKKRYSNKVQDFS